ncbi:MAG: LysM peptidoglycan-binding domain-containing protein [Spirochaetales bacterium]|nr:MAG: LysM peptidoglycan-binding domain-containing protein [Spirochaetales bacterium]
MEQTRRLLSILFLLIACWATAQETVHRMERGETIYTLARIYGVSADIILEYNQIKDPTRIPIGAEIRIPGEMYVVKDGEYIYSIARDLGINWLDLLAANNLDRDDVVRPGDILIIPGLRISSTSGSVGQTVAQVDNSSGSAGVDTDSPDGGTNSDTDSTADSANVSVASTAQVPDAVFWPHPGARTVWNGKFPGIVMDGNPGDEFRAVATGVVSYIAPHTSFGKLILVHGEGGYLYAYAGADRVDVSVGDRVVPGVILGTVGYSPAFQSTRVLFAIWRNNAYVDPTTAPRG